MATILPETCFIVLEAGGIQSNVYVELRENFFYKSVCHAYTIYPNWWDKTDEVLRRTSSITTSTGFAILVLIFREGNTRSISGINATFAINPVQTTDCRQPFIAVQAINDCYKAST